MSNQSSIAYFIRVALAYSIRWIAYNIFTATILTVFSALIFIYITVIGPEMPFLRHIAFLIPNNMRQSTTLDENDILRLYSILATILFVLSIIGRKLREALERRRKHSTQMEQAEASDGDTVHPLRGVLQYSKRRFVTSSVVITLVYLAAFITIPSARMAAGENAMTLYPIFVIFYIIAMVSNTLYIGIDSLANIVSMSST